MTTQDVITPAHYTTGGVETFDYIRAKRGDDAAREYCVCNAIKYLSRGGKKDDEAQDFAKAAWYSQMAAHLAEPNVYTDPRRVRDGTG